MNAIIISKENNLLHICNDENKIDYTFYNKKGLLLDGGVLEIKDKADDINSISKDIISSFKDIISFSKPYVYVEKENADNLIEFIQEENYSDLQEKISNYYNKENDIEEREI